MNAGGNATSIATVAWHFASGYVARWCLVEHDPPTTGALGWPRLVFDAFLKQVAYPPVLIYLKGNMASSATPMPQKKVPLQARIMQRAEVAEVHRAHVAPIWLLVPFYGATAVAANCLVEARLRKLGVSFCGPLLTGRRRANKEEPDLPRVAGVIQRNVGGPRKSRALPPGSCCGSRNNLGLDKRVSIIIATRV